MQPENFPDISALKQMAVMLKEMYDTYVEAGFTRREALTLLGEYMAAVGNRSENNDDDTSGN